MELKTDSIEHIVEDIKKAEKQSEAKPMIDVVNTHFEIRGKFGSRFELVEFLHREYNEQFWLLMKEMNAKG